MQLLDSDSFSCVYLPSFYKFTERIVENAQKQIDKIVKFVHTYWDKHDIIITVKTPQYII